MYGVVEKIDTAMKRCALYYRCRKYYHAVCNHDAKVMTLVTVYLFYNKYCNGELDNKWFVPEKKRMTESISNKNLANN